MIKKWETVERREAGNLKIFQPVWYKRKHPDLSETGDFIVLDSPRWVNIIPITPKNEVIFVKQYRHGIDEVTIEVPGGLVDGNETPQHAGERECLEETGYIGEGSAELLGVNYPNPAFLNNMCWSYVWFNCHYKELQNLDKHEDIEVELISLNKIKEYIISGKIKHSLVLTAFFFYNLKYGL